MRTKIIWLIGSAFILLLTGLAASAETQFAPIADDARAKRSLPPPNKALVFLFRQEPGTPKNVPMWIDGNPIGFLIPRSFYLRAVDPGEYIIAAKADRGVALKVNVQAGRNYFIEQIVDEEGPQVALRQVTYSQGRTAVNRCRLIKTDMSLTATALGKASPELQTKRPPEPAPQLRTKTKYDSVTPPPSKKGLALILKTGSLKLSKRNQSLGTTAGKITTDFEGNATGIISLEGEWRREDGFAIGVEYLRYRNKLNATGTSFTSNMDFDGLWFNGKKYFTTGGIAHPYLGVGVGSVSAKFSGAAVDGNTAGIGLQAMGGVEFRWRDFGVYTELKLISLKTKDNANNKFSADSRGLFIGAVALF